MKRSRVRYPKSKMYEQTESTAELSEDDVKPNLVPLVGLESSRKRRKQEQLEEKITVCKAEVCDQTSESSGNLTADELPSCWSEEQGNYFREKNPWLIIQNGKLGCDTCRTVGRLDLNQHMRRSRLAREWTEIQISSSAEKKKSQQVAFRKKIWEHRETQAHQDAECVLMESRKRNLEADGKLHQAEEEEAICRIFRTAYMIGKTDCAFARMPILVDLQRTNGINMGRMLQSEQSCADICDFIGAEMKKRVVKYIIEKDIQFGVVVDESANISHQMVLLVCLRAAFFETPTTIFFDLIELDNTGAEVISRELVKCLRHHFSKDFLKRNWISFTADGASNILGHTSGVDINLTRPENYPDLVIWNCSTHRLEQAVAAALETVIGLNIVQVFMDELYTLYHTSSKNQEELQSWAEGLANTIMALDRILDIKWSASSNRTVKAIWISYPALHAHFAVAAADPTRDKMERSKYRGLLERLTAVEFVTVLGLMRDALSELTDLSLKLQESSVTLPEADAFLCCKIRVLEAMANGKGAEFTRLAREAAKKMEFQGVSLHVGNNGDAEMNSQQFFQNLVNLLTIRRMKSSSFQASRLSNTNVLERGSFLASCKILYPQFWPENVDVLYGENEVLSLCRRFHLPERQIVEAFKEYKDNGGKVIPPDVITLILTLEMVAVSTAECERSFSSLKTILTRNPVSIPRVSRLLFLNQNGPSLIRFQPQSYVKTWLTQERRMVGQTACTDWEHQEEEERRTLWSFL
ncbi:E3 SUMO-protein ligase KIAA1586 [Microcaecilia unicolor]|uniref:E3 SUMO-protein ligase KIAA1586-like n=1 Tax=Microcaecilia unicolor TaxID=1415580 RepID=A0A6P7XDP8_9AMPH|nr:E3 SUMO-protein ligase KIAA1586-like [Microcaecilia unicolor]XP_030053667.1 E3 SUMO-protein ligase KIAA1586-like [Microcaecilia unicolor]XP_030053676.1 E3 SUMO-protein ligase KIAA1586-like [Microcaecilia unicolor]